MVISLELYLFDMVGINELWWEYFIVIIIYLLKLFDLYDLINDCI